METCKGNHFHDVFNKRVCDECGKSWTQHMCQKCGKSKRIPGWSWCKECHEQD